MSTALPHVAISSPPAAAPRGPNRVLPSAWVEPDLFEPAGPAEPSPLQSALGAARRAAGNVLMAASLVIVTTGDTILFAYTIKVAFDMPPAEEWQAWTLAVGLAVGGLVLAWYLGRHLKAWQAERRRHRESARPHAWLCVLTAFVWALIGVGLTWIRLQAGGELGFDGGGGAVVPTVGELESDSALGLDDQSRGVVLAVLGLALFAAAGALAVVESYQSHNPVARVLRRLERQKARVKALVGALEAEAIWLRGELERHAAESAAAEADYTDAVAYDLAVGAEGKERARVAIAGILGHPSASELIHEPDRCQARTTRSAAPLSHPDAPAASADGAVPSP
jgi:hypothetical protein